MLEQMGIDQVMEAAADRGRVSVNLRLKSTRQRQALQDEGLALSRTSRTGYYIVSWEDAIVEGLPKDWDLDSIFKERPELNQAQRLWLMTQKAE